MTGLSGGESGVGSGEGKGGAESKHTEASALLSSCRRFYLAVRAGGAGLVTAPALPATATVSSFLAAARVCCVAAGAAEGAAAISIAAVAVSHG